MCFGPSCASLLANSVSWYRLSKFIVAVTGSAVSDASGARVTGRVRTCFGRELGVLEAARQEPSERAQ